MHSPIIARSRYNSSPKPSTLPQSEAGEIWRARWMSGFNPKRAQTRSAIKRLQPPQFTGEARVVDCGGAMRIRAHVVPIAGQLKQHRTGQNPAPKSHAGYTRDERPRWLRTMSRSALGCDGPTHNPISPGLRREPGAETRHKCRAIAPPPRGARRVMPRARWSERCPRL